VLVQTPSNFFAGGTSPFPPVRGERAGADPVSDGDLLNLADFPPGFSPPLANNSAPSKTARSLRRSPLFLALPPSLPSSPPPVRWAVETISLSPRIACVFRHQIQSRPFPPSRRPRPPLLRRAFAGGFSLLFNPSVKSPSTLTFSSAYKKPPLLLLY